MKTSKQFLLALFTAVLITFSFASCGGDDENPWSEKSVTKTVISSSVLEGLTSGSHVLTDTISLGKLIGDNSIATNLIKTEFQNSGWSIKINGLKAFAGATPITLKNLKISINGGAAFDLGNWSTNQSSSDNITDSELSSDKFIPFIKAYFNALTTGNKIAILKIEITSNRDFLKKDKVTLDVKTTSKYSYKDYNIK